MPTEDHSPMCEDRAALREKLQKYMDTQGLRHTGQRTLIIDTFLGSNEHVSVDDVLERVRKVDPKVGYATVYRALRLFADSGIAEEHRFGDGITRFELNLEGAHHDHLICEKCGKIEEFEEPRVERIQEEIAERYGFKLIDHKHELYGLCPSCQS